MPARFVTEARVDEQPRWPVPGSAARPWERIGTPGRGRARPGRGRSRLAALAIAAGLAAALACGKDDAPLGGGPANGPAGIPELATGPKFCVTNAPPPINRLIDVQFSRSEEDSVRTVCSSILRKAPIKPDLALEQAVQLSDYIRDHSSGSPNQQRNLINAFLCVAQNQTPGSSCTFSLPAGAEYNVVGPGGGGPFFVAGGTIGYQLADGWSTTSRIVFTVPGPCELVTPFEQFRKCAKHGTIPDGPLASVGSGILAHCAIVPNSVNTANLRLARNLDDFNDPMAADDSVGGVATSEHFPDFTPPFSLPDCSSSEALEGAEPSLRAAGGSGLAGKAGPNGAQLAGTTKVQGGQISSFSDWGIVDIGSAAATITGRVVEDCAECDSPIAGAAVDLFCDDGISEETPAGPTVYTAADGTFSFASGPYDFGPGSTCLVTAAAEGFFSGGSGTFPVSAGANPIGDIALEPID